ncbi:MAG TPA: DUF1080 domain-containing protein [Verrucomicrobiales bacterium]|nr:DUF1080 domain-containing protein [Verrucomicrobiales bacterium]|tara:strand:+ start:3099 stop:3713 length:615 start_codon:yes stop_codon:yes gene_type:complete
MKVALLALLGLSSLALADHHGKEQSLFNGKDFTGWKVPKNNIWWSVADEMIVAKSGPKKRGSNLWSEKEFEDFDMVCDFRFDGSGDSGVFLRDGGQQIQIGISGSLKRDMTASPYIAGKGYPVEAEATKGVKGVKSLLRINDWNTLRVRAEGPKYDAWLNGVHVMTYTSTNAKVKGPVGLQLHGNKVMSIDFRKLSITEITKKG